MKSQQVSTNGGQVPNSVIGLDINSLRKTPLEVQPADVMRSQGVQVWILHLTINHMEATTPQDIYQPYQRYFGGVGCRTKHGFAEEYSTK
jgi:hypothetical protein